MKELCTFFVDLASPATVPNFVYAQNILAAIAV